MKGFPKTWCNCMKSFVQGSNIGIKANEEQRPYIQTMKGLRQGDSLSSIIFIVVNMVATIIAGAKEDAQVKRGHSSLSGRRLSILQSTDDMIIFMDHDIDQAKKYEVNI